MGVCVSVFIPFPVGRAEQPQIVVQPEGVVWVWDGTSSLLRSLDEGATWEERALPEPGQGRVAFSGANHGLASGRNGIWRTSDGGNTWTHVGISGWGANGQIVMGSGGEAAAYSERQLWWTSDGGTTWEAVVPDGCGDLKGGIAHLLYVRDGMMWLHKEYGRPLVEGLFRIAGTGECDEWYTFAPGSVFNSFGGIGKHSIILVTGDKTLHEIDPTVRNAAFPPSFSLSDEIVRVLGVGFAGHMMMFSLGVEKGSNEVVLLIGSTCGNWQPMARWPRGQVTDVGFLDESHAIAVGRNGYLAYSEDQGRTWRPIVRKRQ